MKGLSNNIKLFSNYLENENFQGHDLYDGLNGKLLKVTPLYNSSLIRLCAIQFFKRCPINLRSLFFVPKGFNPKAGALFLLGYLRMYQSTGEDQYLKPLKELIKSITDAKISRQQGHGWGYNFDWQAKAFYVPMGTPNIVTSVYVGHALLDYYEQFQEEEVKSLSLGIKDFILNEMINWEKDTTLCFSYIPGKSAEVHNASLMAAAFLSRVNKMDPDPQMVAKIKKAVQFSLNDIGDDGYWPYGTLAHHRWMDNFHTAFNLEALLEIKTNLNTLEYDEVLKKVFTYYINIFFLSDGRPKYYHNNLYPIDIHTIAEAIVFLSKVIQEPKNIFSDEDRDRARQLNDQLVALAMNQFWDKKRRYFYYQKTKYYINKIPYIRWSQAWMFYALACYQLLEREETS